MIRLFDREEKDFTTRGLGSLKDTLKCYVSEELNGMYELYMEYSIFSPKALLIKEQNIIYTSAPRGEQAFRIYKVIKNVNILKIYARHIFYDLADNFISETEIKGQNGSGAIDQILSKTDYSHEFRGMSDISSIRNMKIKEKNPLEAILSNENSFVSLWGGEVLRENYDIKILDNIGEDRGVNIKYGKNLLGIEEELDLSDVCTKIMPIGDKDLLLPELYVESENINKYVHPKVRKIEFKDVKVREKIEENDLESDDNKSYETKELAYEELRRRCKRLFEINKIDIPNINYKVNFLELTKTEEYKKYSILEKVFLGDTITIKHSILDINIKAKVISYKYNSILNCYEELELGNYKSSLLNIVNKIDDIVNSLEGLDQIILDKAKEKATELINSGLGGYVVKKRDEILIMDTDNINTAMNVWRWNKNGLGYSSTGYNGKFGLAMTADGSIVADFITTGMLNGELIKAGSVKAKSISQEYKTEITNEINGSVSSLEQSFIVANGILESSIRSTNDDVYNLGNRVSSAESKIQQTANSITSTVQDEIYSNNTTNRVKSIIQQSPSSVQVAFNDINPSVDLSSSGSFEIINGRLQVKNNNNMVVIDGQYNIHKIMVTGEVTISISGSKESVTVEINHGLGYMPAYSCYALLDEYDRRCINLPSMSLSMTGGVYGFDSITRARVNKNYLYLDYIRTPRRAASMGYESYKIKYFIYKEVAF